MVECAPRSRGRLFLGVYNGAGRVMEKFLEGFKAGGLAHSATRFALRGMKEGPMYNGRGNYAAPDAVEQVLAQFGFRLSPEHEVEVEMRRKAAKPTAFLDAVNDLPALATRLEADPSFAAEFAGHPEVASILPANMHFCAVKV